MNLGKRRKEPRVEKEYSSLNFVFALLVAPLPLMRRIKRGPSTPEERKRAVEMATFLEKNPLAKEAKDQRAALLYFLTEAPDIKISLL